MVVDCCIYFLHFLTILRVFIHAKEEQRKSLLSVLHLGQSKFIAFRTTQSWFSSQTFCWLSREKLLSFSQRHRERDRVRDRQTEWERNRKRNKREGETDRQRDRERNIRERDRGKRERERERERGKPNSTLTQLNGRTTSVCRIVLSRGDGVTLPPRKFRPLGPFGSVVPRVFG